MRSTWRVADSEDVEDADSSSIGGVKGRGCRTMGEPRQGVVERDRSVTGEELEDASMRIGGGGDLETRGLFIVAPLLLEDRRRRLEVGGDEDMEDDERGMTYDASISAARLWCCSTGADAGVGSGSGDAVVCAVWAGSGVGGGRASGRTPRVEGRVIRSAASEESIYIVNARGGGATKWLRSCTESCRFEVDWDAWCWR